MAYFDGHPNVVQSAVATAPSPATTGTSVTVTTGHGARFPAAKMPFNATIGPSDLSTWSPTNTEIVRVTAVAGDVLTITRTQESTSARTVVVGDGLVVGATEKTVTDIQKALWVPITEVLSFGTSLTTGYGGTSAEWAWPARFAKALNADHESFGQNGAVLTNDDATPGAAGDGGWATVFKRLKASRTAAPYLSAFGTVILHYGGNDVSQYGTSNAVRDTFKGAMRAAIGRARISARFSDNHASVTKSGASHANLTGSEDSLPDGRLGYITSADGSYWQIAVPADYAGGGAVWFFLGAQTTNGALSNVLVDGSSSGFTINNVSTNQVDNRNMGTLAGSNSLQGYRIPLAAAGAHTVRITPATIVGSVACFCGWGVEAEVPPVVITPQQNKLNSYAAYSGAPFPPTDTVFDTLSQWIADVAAEFSDGRVVAKSHDAALNKDARYFYAGDLVHFNDSGAEVVAGVQFDGYREAALLDGRSLMAAAKKNSIPAARQPNKRPCRVASVANITISSAPATIDGVTPNYFDRVLVKNQTTASENGIYLWVGASRPLERTTDFDSSDDIFNGCEVYVEEGTYPNARTKWAIANQGTIVVGTTAIRWTRTSPDLMMNPQRSFWTANSNAIETISRDQAISNLGALSSGRLSLIGGIVIPAGVTVSNITFWSNATASGTPTHGLFGLYRQSTLARLAQTADFTTEAWAANSAKTKALTAAYTPDEDMPVYLGIMIVATTVPTLTAALTTSQIMGVTPIMHATSTTGLVSTIPDPAGALTAAAGKPYAYVS